MPAELFPHRSKRRGLWQSRAQARRDVARFLRPLIEPGVRFSSHLKGLRRTPRPISVLHPAQARSQPSRLVALLP
jgi:hypothetical protein